LLLAVSFARDVATLESRARVEVPAR
jgi:hypothetical protein